MAITGLVEDRKKLVKGINLLQAQNVGVLPLDLFVEEVSPLSRF